MVSAKAKGAMKVSPKISKKKPDTARPEPLHPPYMQMISEAIATLKERTGSSQQAIGKYVGQKYHGKLPSNFNKLLLVQLRSLVKKGKLIKIKASYKLSDELKKIVSKAIKQAETESVPASDAKRAVKPAARKRKQTTTLSTVGISEVEKPHPAKTPKSRKPKGLRKLSSLSSVTQKPDSETVMKTGPASEEASEPKPVASVPAKKPKRRVVSPRKTETKASKSVTQTAGEPPKSAKKGRSKIATTPVSSVTRAGAKAARVKEDVGSKIEKKPSQSRKASSKNAKAK